MQGLYLDSSPYESKLGMIPVLIMNCSDLVHVKDKLCEYVQSYITATTIWLPVIDTDDALK